MAGQVVSISSRAAQHLRKASDVMDLERLGCSFAHPLSFMRILIRRMKAQNWHFSRRRFALDSEGDGDVIYEITTPERVFSLVVFSHKLDPSLRSDRVIAEAWDVTMVLRHGHVDADTLERLRANVPLQEKGRVDSECIVLSRANRSERSFGYVLECLCRGEQPDPKRLASIGYLYRTTAVYGSGKFGMADWQKVVWQFPEFGSPFLAEMLVCFLIRQFSLDQVHHIAACKSPRGAVRLAEPTQRYMGIGNATGLGMAPYLINHPLLIARWIEVRETALAEILARGSIADEKWQRFAGLTARACQHLGEIDTDNTEQNAKNHGARNALADFIDDRVARGCEAPDWAAFMKVAREALPPTVQEILNACLLETYVDEISHLEDALCVEEHYPLQPKMPVARLQDILREHYDWALEIDFSDTLQTQKFWYRSEEKMEPRLGDRAVDDGVDKEMTLGIARAVYDMAMDLTGFASANPEALTAEFVLMYPGHRAIIRRVQTMAQTYYGDIRANLLHADVMPIHLLRCKLSFFGVSKFDPRSKLWVRNTMFQGAPTMDDIGVTCKDDWAFPTCPDNV